MVRQQSNINGQHQRQEYITSLERADWLERNVRGQNSCVSWLDVDWKSGRDEADLIIITLRLGLRGSAACWPLIQQPL